MLCVYGICYNFHDVASFQTNIWIRLFDNWIVFIKNISLLKLKTHKYIEKYINISISYTYRLKIYLLFSLPAYFLKHLKSFTWLLINSKAVFLEIRWSVISIKFEALINIIYNFKQVLWQKPSLQANANPLALNHDILFQNQTFFFFNSL